MYRINYYKHDPRWIAARYPTRCHCGEEIKRGDRAYYYPRGKKVVCEKCGLMGEMALIDDDMNQMLKVF